MALQGDSHLSHRESQTLNCLLWKLDFYPLRLESGFPCSPEARLEKHATLWGHKKLAVQTSSHLWPSRTSLNADPEPGFPLGVCLLAMPTRRCHLFDMAPPPLSACRRLMTITAQEDKEVSVFAETDRHESPPNPSVSFTLQIPKPYYKYNASINNQPLLGFVRARWQHAIWSWYQQLIKQLIKDNCKQLFFT